MEEMSENLQSCKYYLRSGKQTFIVSASEPESAALYWVSCQRTDGRAHLMTEAIRVSERGFNDKDAVSFDLARLTQAVAELEAVTDRMVEKMMKYRDEKDEEKQD